MFQIFSSSLFTKISTTPENVLNFFWVLFNYEMLDFYREDVSFISSTMQLCELKHTGVARATSEQPAASP